MIARGAARSFAAFVPAFRRAQPLRTLERTRGARFTLRRRLRARPGVVSRGSEDKRINDACMTDPTQCHSVWNKGNAETGMSAAEYVRGDLTLVEGNTCLTPDEPE